MLEIKLNSSQLEALRQIKQWFKTSEPFFVLSGSAGSGKTFTTKALVEEVKGRIIFTAPTNKAVRVLRKTLTTKEYIPEARTIYSLLGLRLEANGEVKELSTPEDPVDLTSYRLVVVDEASMINQQVMSYITRVAKDFGVRFLFLGDRAQLPPIGERESLVWRISGYELTSTERFGGPILKLAVSLREKLAMPMPSFKPYADNDSKTGIWLCAGDQYLAQIAAKAKAGHFQIPDAVKALAWRNVTVDSMNLFIRRQIFDDVSQPWVPSDRITLTGPVSNLDGEPMGSTDDEGSISRVEVDFHPIYPEYKVYRITFATDEGKTLPLLVLHPDSQQAFDDHKARLASEARVEKRRWRHFWELIEAFHPVRHAYAGTVHRAQGSTYENVFVDWRDIMLNRNRTEAIQALYVATTRPSLRLIFN